MIITVKSCVYKLMIIFVIRVIVGVFVIGILEFLNDYDAQYFD